MANSKIVAQLTARSGAHGIEGGSIDNLDDYTDLVVNECVRIVRAQIKDKKLENKVVAAIYSYFSR